MATPGAVLAGVGLTHPHHLDAGSAGWWRDMHVLLAFVFLLLGVVIWMLMEPASGLARWLGRLAAAATIRHTGRGAVPGGFLVLAGGVVFVDSHIYWPAGVLAMCGIAIGFAQLGWSAHPDSPRSPPPAATGRS